MPLPEYSIGDQSFAMLTAPPEVPNLDLEVITRPGSPGVGIYRLGNRGRPITLVSEVDLADKGAALTRWREYLAMKGQDPVNVIWADQSFDTDQGAKCIVLDVRIVPPLRELLTAVGGINVDDGDPCVWLVCEWTLISLANSTEEVV